MTPSIDPGTQVPPRSRAITLAWGVAVLLVSALLWKLLDTGPLPPDEVFEAVLIGKPIRITLPEGDRVFLLTENPVKRHFYGYSSGTRLRVPTSEVRIRVDLLAFAVPGGDLLWRRQFEENEPGLMTPVSDYLVAHGDVLELALREPVRISALDGSPVADLPPGRPAQRGEDAYDLRDLQERGRRDGNRWLGALTAEEQARFTGAGGGDWRPDALGAPGGDARYLVWRARVEDVREAWGNRARYSDFQALPAAPPLHRAGLLRVSRQAEAMVLQAPESILLLHEAADAPGTGLWLTRLETTQGAVQWSTSLPHASIRFLMAGPDDLAIVGPGPQPSPSPDGNPGAGQVVGFLDLASGSLRRVDIGGLAPGLPTAAD